MQKLKKLYRSNYVSENVITELRYENGEWTPSVEAVPNQVFNTHTTSQAIAIGNGESRLQFDLAHIARHKGGLFGADRLQSYGCNALYRDFTPDFLVAVGDTIVEEIANSGFCDDHIVYAHGQHLSQYSEKFYLIPQNVSYDAGSLAVYLACFDGHKKVFLLGYDGYDMPGPVNNVYKDTNGYPAGTEIHSENFWNLSLLSVIQTYQDVDFVSVMPTPNWYVPTEIAKQTNFRQVDFRNFVLEADIN
jgi:hypothetical protein